MVNVDVLFLYFAVTDVVSKAGYGSFQDKCSEGLVHESTSKFSSTSMFMRSRRCWGTCTTTWCVKGKSGVLSAPKSPFGKVIWLNSDSGLSSQGDSPCRGGVTSVYCLGTKNDR